jgi:hypothetical protein
MFGKPVSTYLQFQRVALALLLVVGIARIALSASGAPKLVVAWCSLNLVGWAATFWYGAAVHRRGFGSYRQLLPLVFVQSLAFHLIAVAGILLAIAGLPNAFAAPEYSGGVETNQWVHIAAHLTIGLVATTLIWWGVGSLSMAVTKRVTPPQPAAA